MKIALLYTGGTIGCFYEPLRPLTTEEFGNLFKEHMVPVLKSKFPNLELGFIPFGPPTLDSTNLEPKDWCTIAELILPEFGRYDGFIILHGTDTMAYTASALSFLFTGLDGDGVPNALLDKPIVVTGSQVPIFYGESPETGVLRFDTDAFQNVCGAVSAATSRIPEVSLFFNHKLMRGNRCTKTSANQFDAFHSPNYPPLAEAGIGFTVNHTKVRSLPPSAKKSLTSTEARGVILAQLQVIKKHIADARVQPFIAYPTAVHPHYGEKSYLSAQLDAVLHLGDENLQLKAIILESYGEGNFPSGNPDDPTKGAVYQTLTKATQQGVIVVDNTQVLGGVVDCNAYASGSWMSDENIRAVGAFDMTPIATYTKLIYLLSLAKAHDWEVDKIRSLVDMNLVGEMMDTCSIDCHGQVYLIPGESITSTDGTARLTNVPSKGPQLFLKNLKTGEWGEEAVWSAVEDMRTAGVLAMLNDGNLVLRNPSNATLWETNTAQKDHSASRLVLLGQRSSVGVSLFVLNYAKNEITSQLYPSEGNGNKRQRTT